MYNSAPYLPTYLESLENLEGGYRDLEILFVDDGSPDESGRLVRAWMQAHDVPARLIRKEHGGSGSARNRGIDEANGTWISFPDPDDALDPGYLAAIRTFLAGLGDRASEVCVLAAKVLQYTGSPLDAVDNHILGYRYHGGARCADLRREPRYFHTHIPSGFYRNEVLKHTGLRLDVQLSAAFEDAAFEAEYLVGFDRPIVGYVPDARYSYGRRVDSVIHTMWTKPERYTTVVERGYLRLLELQDPAPLWLQNLILYDLWWMFYEYEQPDAPNRSLGAETRTAFLDLLGRVLDRIDVGALYGFSPHPVPLHTRVALVVRKTGRLVDREARLSRHHDDPELVRITYFALPGEEAGLEVVTADGLAVEPLGSAWHAIEYYGETFLLVRTIDIRAGGTLMLSLDGETRPLSTGDSGVCVSFPWDRPRRPADR
jgi:glycosyltransferase involved in cell wall biosynthesis